MKTSTVLNAIFGCSLFLLVPKNVKAGSDCEISGDCDDGGDRGNFEGCISHSHSCTDTSECCGTAICHMVLRVDGQGGMECDNHSSFKNTVKDYMPSECYKTTYDIDLHAVKGPHLFIAATLPMTEDPIKGTKDTNCPSSLAFHSIKGKKNIVELDKKDRSLDSFHLGSAKLSDILKAEENAIAIEPSNYDFAKNNCVRYASDIWRSLDIDETTELAEFIIENVSNDSGLEDLLKMYVDKGSFRAKAMYSIGGNVALKSFVTDVVYDQLDIVDGEEKAVTE